jgi:putative sterol carrier protein
MWRRTRRTPAREEFRVSDKHAFLSDGWFDAAGKLINQHSTDGPPAPNLVMNLEVTDGDKKTEFHMGARDGQTLFGKGHTDGADLTLSTDIDTAREVFVANNPAAGMQAFMAGKVRIQGDMTKLMMAQAGGQGGNSQLTEALQSITE